MGDATRWLAVPGYEALYEVSSDGQVRSRRRKGSAGGILRPGTNPAGYLEVNLSKDGVVEHVAVHRVVARAFLGQLPTGHQTRHIDGDLVNNSVENLRYVTSAEIAYDRVRHGRHHNALKTHCPAGHEYTPSNTLRTRDGRARKCRTCKREKRRAAANP